MSVLVLTDERFADHLTGSGHPECPERLAATLGGLRVAGLTDVCEFAAPNPAAIDDVLRVHDPEMVDRARTACAHGVPLDPDTPVVPSSWDAALLAAGAGLDAVKSLESGANDLAFCLVRPPGHHATPTRSMGFCILNNVAVTAASLAARGERVLIADVDAHHGNGTQDAFWDDPRVLFVSWHQSPLYPGSGELSDTGGDGAPWSTLNLPMPPGATGDHYRSGFDRVVAPLAAAFDPTWVLVSAGFDGHRDDPLTSLGLTSGDYADLIVDLATLVPAGRTILFLEGGYDLAALGNCAGAVVSAMVDAPVRPEPATAGGPGAAAVDAIERLWDNR